MRIITLAFLFSFWAFGQQESVLVIGNHSNICFDNCPAVEITDSFPDDLEVYSVILLFSNSTSQLKSDNINQLAQFLERGGGLYSGSENWPMQAESNQITHYLYKKESFGNFNINETEVSQVNGNLNLQELPAIPAGTSTVAFPLDYRLQVEVWLNDQALILSGNIGEGRIIIDGGYSRFYCSQRTNVTDALLDKIVMYLLGY
ncbi:MAG: hypothetical protein QNK23_07065 [Crocinitomicaceae bacterium]|nr:hypothetical protein [Crocinitomicaceae bacterium]